MFTDYGVVESGNIVSKTNVEYVFKSAQPNQTIFVRAKDILNIRSEFNSIDLGEYRIISRSPHYDFISVKDDFFMYHVTILIQLNP